MYEREEDVCYGIKKEPNVGLQMLIPLTKKYTNAFTNCCPYKKVTFLTNKILCA